MNEDSAKDLVKQVLDIDKAITDQQLGAEWFHPKMYNIFQYILVLYVI